MVFESSVRDLLGLLDEGKVFEAESFYRLVVFPDVVSDFVSRHDKSFLGLPDRVDVLVVSVGKSWAPVALSILFFKPVFVVALVTSESRFYFDEALVEVRKRGDFEFDTYVISVDKLDVGIQADGVRGYLQELYDFLKQRYYFVGGSDKRVVKIVFDVTGGKKPMSISLSLLAENLRSVLDFAEVRVFYIDAVWDPKLQRIRAAFPGSERLVEIDSPIFSKFDFEVPIIKSLFSEYAYNVVIARVSRLKKFFKVGRRAKILELAHLMAEAYRLWLFSGDFRGALKRVDKVLRLIEKWDIYTDDFVKSMYYELAGNRTVLGEIVKSLGRRDYGSRGALVLALDYYFRAKRFRKLGLEDVSLCLIKRSLDIVQKYVLEKDYGLNVTRPDYKSSIYSDHHRFAENYRYYAEYFGLNPIPPKKIGLIEGALILLALNHGEYDFKTVKIIWLVWRNCLRFDSKMYSKLEKLVLKLIGKLGNVREIEKKLIYPFEPKGLFL